MQVAMTIVINYAATKNQLCEAEEMLPLVNPAKCSITRRFLESFKTV